MGDTNEENRDMNEKAQFNASRTAYLDLREGLALQAAKRNPFVHAAFLLFCLGAVALYYLDARGYALGSVFLALVSMFFLDRPDRWLSANEYHGLPGSRFENGGDRCILCGSAEIQRDESGLRKRTHVSCSVCHNSLFVE